MNLEGTQAFRTDHSSPVYILKVETIGFANRWDLQCENKRGVKDNPSISGLSH